MDLVDKASELLVEVVLEKVFYASCLLWRMCGVQQSFAMNE